ncbi:IS200/IS605 family element transposase accessory protein TnpB (plasmid) [Acidiphilium multivorum]|uniref:RNA-guided endonuclease InsQ/TnpB family protein n=3 Tax=Acidocellaceae TaxID=3385905 RepID=UPI00157AA401|nr:MULTISPECIES: RNA-guided endonuclease TnpB family protein [Acidiphilium]UNC16135.1 IS200/IS605 family element transposase accessory protein TnpB [Acidiphilium multivorum]
MILAHKIALDPTVEQAIHFARAAGTARFAWNWGIAEWKRLYEAGGKPSATKLKAQWNAVRRTEFPWSCDVTKCASGQAIMNLGTAFGNFFRDLKKPKGQRKAGYPKFKKKGQHDSFALWNDQFEAHGCRERFGKDRGEIRIPNLGWVRMREPLRIGGRILGAVVSREAGRWFVAIQCEMPDAEAAHPAPGSVVGVDLGISALMALSRQLLDGRTKIENPKSLRKAMRRVKKLSRRISRQEEARKKRAAKTSRRMRNRRAQLAKLHGRVANIRRDAIHKATTAVASTFETIVLEDLNVAGMGKNHALAGSVSDAAFGEIRRQFEYKARMRGGHVHVADRFFPSSKTCSACGCVVDKLPLSARSWACAECGTVHDRDENAAINLEHLVVGPAWAEPSPGNPAATLGEIAALAASQEAVKLRSVNRELNPCAHVRTN